MFLAAEVEFGMFEVAELIDEPLLPIFRCIFMLFSESFNYSV